MDERRSVARAKSKKDHALHDAQALFRTTIWIFFEFDLAQCNPRADVNYARAYSEDVGKCRSKRIPATFANPRGTARRTPSAAQRPRTKSCCCSPFLWSWRVGHVS